MPADADVPRRFHAGDRTGVAQPSDGKLTFSKVDAVFKSGNSTRDTIPSHLIARERVPAEVARFYAHMCPAGVYEATGEAGVGGHAPHCVDCEGTDGLGPRWRRRERGSGPQSKRR